MIIEREDRSMMELEVQGLKLVVHGSMYILSTGPVRDTL